MKRSLVLLAIPLFLSVVAANANARSAGSSASDATPAKASQPSLGGEVQYARTMAHRVHEELSLYGSDRHIRQEVKQIDADVLRVNKEFSTRSYDPDHIRAEIARIDDEFHRLDYELRDMMAHEPDRLTGGSMPRVR